jgi:hypothetical protein
MKFVALMVVVAGLAGCGANGEPLRPTASTNLSIGTGGVSAGTNLGLSNGIFSVGLGQSTSLN